MTFTGIFTIDTHEWFLFSAVEKFRNPNLPRVLGHPSAEATCMNARIEKRTVDRLGGPSRREMKAGRRSRRTESI